MGGTNLQEKFLLLNNLVEVADHIIIGGEIAFTFLHAIGY